MPSGDVVAGVSDSKAYVFSSDEVRQGPSDMHAAFEAEVAVHAAESAPAKGTGTSCTELRQKYHCPQCHHLVHFATLQVYRLDKTVQQAVLAGGVPEDQIKSPSALQVPGTEDNASMIVRETNGKLMAYVWSNDANEWTVLGEVMDRPEDTMDVPKKVL